MAENSTEFVTRHGSASAEGAEVRQKCKRCGKEIFLEDDDLITCGNAFVVWYSIHENGKRAMTCDGLNNHEPEATTK